MPVVQAAQPTSKVKSVQVKFASDSRRGVAITDKNTAEFLIKVNDLAKAV